MNVSRRTLPLTLLNDIYFRSLSGLGRTTRGPRAIRWTLPARQSPSHPTFMYIGPPIDDEELLDALPVQYRELLARANGYVAFGGGLHIRGACSEPTWHSLRDAWFGRDALHRLYGLVQESDIPFGEDAFGDQFLLRSGVVYRLAGETGEVESLEVDLYNFDRAIRADPVGYLSLAPLEEFRAQGGAIQPGQLLDVFPPFVIKSDSSTRSYRAIGALERRRWLAHLAEQLRDLPDGTAVRFGADP